MARPVSPLTSAAAAHDDDEKVKNEDEFLKTPKTFKMQITVTGIDFTPDPPDQVVLFAAEAYGQLGA